MLTVCMFARLTIWPWRTIGMHFPGEGHVFCPQLPSLPFSLASFSVHWYHPLLQLSFVLFCLYEWECPVLMDNNIFFWFCIRYSWFIIWFPCTKLVFWTLDSFLNFLFSLISLLNLGKFNIMHPNSAKL